MSQPSAACSKPDCSSCKSKARQLTLDDWTVFAADAAMPNLPLPQQVEAEVCTWLRFMAMKLGMVANPDRLYGNIAFDTLGELFDFEIKMLQPQMLNVGFDNWMNTLASGEVLIDIVNGLIDRIPPAHAGPQTAHKDIKWQKLPNLRMLNTAPNMAAVCAFLVNHDNLFWNFLEPIVKVLRPNSRLAVCTCAGGSSAKSGAFPDIRVAMKMVQCIGHTLLRNSYTTREWTWKALMLVVMTLMVLTGSLGESLMELYTVFTGEPDIEQLMVPELHEAYLSLKDSNVFNPADFKSLADMPNHFPYKRVLKQGHIDFKSLMAQQFNLE